MKGSHNGEAPFVVFFRQVSKKRSAMFYIMADLTIFIKNYLIYIFI